MTRPPPFVLDALRNERKRLGAERMELDRKIVEIDAFLRASKNTSQEPTDDPSFQKKATP